MAWKREGPRVPDGSREPQLCLITHALYPVADIRMVRAAHAARDAGYRVQVIARRTHGEKFREVVDGIHVLRLPIRHVRPPRLLEAAFEYISSTMLAGAAAALLHLRLRFDVVEVHAPPDFLVLAGVLPALFGSKLVLDIRDLSPHMWDARFADRRGARIVEGILRVAERAACALADQVVTVHEPYRKELAAHGIPAEHVAVVMNTPDEEMFERLELARGDSNSTSGFTVAYHGTITDWYGVDLLVRAIAELDANIPDIHGLILGQGDGLPGVKSLASELGVLDKLTFTDRQLPFEEVLARVATADCGVIPNPPSELNRFILSNKLFEYIHLGIPVVAARLETIATHFSADEITFFEPGDARALVVALRWIEDNPAEAHERASRAQARSASYSWKRERRRYVSLLQGLTDGGRSLAAR